MGGTKRPSVEIPPEVLERAVAFRKAGMTYRAIAAEVGFSRSALHERLRNRADLAEGAPMSPENIEFAGDLDDLAEKALLAGHAVVQQVGVRLSGRRCATCGLVGEKFTVTDAAELVSISERAKKLSEELRGRRGRGGPTAVVNVGMVAHTPQEANVLAALRAQKEVRGAEPG